MLTATEAKWHSHELETLALVEILKRFRIYLLDKPFKVVTDCNSVKAAKNKKDLVLKIARRWLQMQEFTFEIEHRSGKQMGHVDALSRNPSNDESDFTENFILRIETADWLLAGQLTDLKIKALREILQKKNPQDDYEKRIHKEYCLKSNKLYIKKNNKELWIVPQGMRREVVRCNHDEIGHPSSERTIEKLVETFWFPKMRDYVHKYIKGCIPCLYYKTPRGRQEGFLNPIPKVAVPFHTVHVDHLGPFNNSGGKKYILSLIDGFTKFLVIRAVKDTKTAPVIVFLTYLFGVYGVPTHVITDRGTAFTSHKFKNFLESKNIQHILNAVATPRANGQVERYNATILNALATSIRNDKDWSKPIEQTQFAINNN